ncbi:MAG: NAD(P)H-dependent oxidoreductase [Cytophagaceae bacterium]|nr:NAD(P)H-dependent oxidoreductase [Cytophagaceae bacterium]
MLNYTIISGSIRQNRNSHRVSLHLMERINSEPNSKAQLIDLAEANLPVMTDLWDKHPQHTEAYTKLADTLKNSDAFIWVSPEYNGSYTAALKNFIDHFPKQAFYRKPVGVVSVSTGALGGIRGAMNMQELALAVQAYALPQMLLVPQVTAKFDSAGAVTDETFSKQLNLFVTELTWLSDALKNKVDSNQ